MRRLIGLFLALFPGGTYAQQPFPTIQPVNFSKVTINDHFWAPRIKTVAEVTIPVCMEQTEVKTPRIRNFEKVARRQGEKHEGIFYDDSDVFKAIEAIAYSLKNHPNPDLGKKTDEWIDKIAAAQLADGYLNTYYTLGDLSRRWTDMSMHEDYNGGHLIEAAVAYYDATGKRKLLDVAIRWADHFDSRFGEGKKHWVTGHQELELALVKLYRVTKDEKYLRLADWLLAERGHKLAYGYTWSEWRDTAYAQDVLPVKEQTEITGHAVRAMYLYTGAADVASHTQDVGYMNAMKKVWEDVVFRNMYITGGIGSSGSNEGFSVDYDLPNENAYCETCASVGMVFWNLRMFRLTGESKYIDVLERSLYNAANDGLSLQGNLFFYGNPLASDGRHKRREWFGTACCPANIARLISSLGDYVYATSQDGLWVNLYVSGSTRFSVSGREVAVEMNSEYPWEGRSTLTVNPARKSRFTLRLRVPGWATGQPVPGNTYFFLDKSESRISIRVNGSDAVYTMKDGYAVINRDWKAGDQVQINFPMEVRRVGAIEPVKDNVNRVALQRGPLVYCIEHPDNHGKAWNVILPDQAAIKPEKKDDLLGGVVILRATVPVVVPDADGLSVRTEPREVTAIPYYAWANRGQGQMQVWIPRRAEEVRVR